jgi:hypothetical protein
MRWMIFNTNRTFQRILASIAQGGGGWSSTPPKFALDQKKPLRSLQRPPVGGTDHVGNHWSRQCGILDISQTYEPIRPGTRAMALLLMLLNIYKLSILRFTKNKIDKDKVVEERSTHSRE